MDRMFSEIPRQLLEYKDGPEKDYGVEIPSEALNLAFLFANEEVGSDNFEDQLQKEAFGLVKDACLRLRRDLDTDAEENALDTNEYLLCRALVELEEIKKEKDHGKRIWIPRVEKEYQDLMDKWNRFMRKSKPIVMERNRCNKRGDQELQMLEQVRQGLVSFMQEAEADKKTAMKSTFGMKSGPGPLGSFLFLFGSGRGRTEHAKALAKQLFVDDKLLTEVDISDYGSQILPHACLVPPPECGAGGLVTEAMKKRPFVVILLDNVDRAHLAVTDLLIKILSHGRVLDGASTILMSYDLQLDFLKNGAS
ncbi:hypothetical protein RHSIM_Rhsim03G0004100 [Rhododendron simsii]|uniref:ATPase AAA-type core domain-containing protein n=1 Tax=Rhododendron simsii TaxID=118357 RepID=A0A834H6V3_RHOSS|nr:hypothetical protein RHSIM_Rhsim03G0004100 [Rhododendron simsii]